MRKPLLQSVGLRLAPCRFGRRNQAGGLCGHSFHVGPPRLRCSRRGLHEAGSDEQFVPVAGSNCPSTGNILFAGCGGAPEAFPDRSLVGCYLRAVPRIGLSGRVYHQPAGPGYVSRCAVVRRVEHESPFLNQVVQRPVSVGDDEVDGVCDEAGLGLQRARSRWCQADFGTDTTERALREPPPNVRAVTWIR